MSEHITGFQTAEGEKKYDYNALANLPLIPSISGCANALIGTASGAVVCVNDVSPIEHKIGCKVRSKNLFNDTDDYKGYEYSYSDGIITIPGRYIHKYILLEEGKTYTFSCKSTRTGTDGGGIYIRGYTEDKVGYVDLSAGSLINQLSPTVTVTMPKGYPYIRLAFYGFFDAEGSGTATYTDIMLEEGAEATGYVPYVDITAATVARYGKNLLDLSRATFTSAAYNEAVNGVTCKINNGYYSGVRVDYLNSFLLANKGKSLTFSIAQGIEGALISLVIYGTRTSGKTNQEGSATGEREISFAISEEFTAITGLEVRVNRYTTAFTDTETVIRNMQVEVSEAATDFEAYKEAAVYTPDASGTVEGVTSITPTITLLTDTENTVIECEYARDVGAVLTELLERGHGAVARISEVTILASAWLGTASPYSQVVTVEGATANSQVDLTPSVEQLAIFYNKDLAFVTENEDGVVTVYAIGEKPTNDYTIQVTITEVDA